MYKLKLLVTAENMNEITYHQLCLLTALSIFLSVRVGRLRNLQWLVYFLLAIQLLESQQSQILLLQGGRGRGRGGGGGLSL